MYLKPFIPRVKVCLPPFFPFLHTFLVIPHIKAVEEAVHVPNSFSGFIVIMEGEGISHCGAQDLYFFMEFRHRSLEFAMLIPELQDTLASLRMVTKQCVEGLACGKVISLGFWIPGPSHTQLQCVSN